jgi:hypothetical protein
MSDVIEYDDGLIAEGENEQFALPDGTTVGTGNLRVSGGPPKMLRAFPDELLLEDKEIQKLLAGRKLEAQRAKRRKRMQNQGQIGSCNARMAVGMYYQVAESTGIPHRPLAPEHLYMNINGDTDGGSLLDRGMKRFVTHGCAGYGLVPFQSYRRRQVQNIAAADEDALRALIHEPYAMPEDYKSYVRAFASASARGWPIGIAWHVTGSSMRLRGQFCVVGGGAGNHASFIHDSIWVGGEDLVHGDLNNSWGPTEDQIYGPRNQGWGDGGFGLITLQDLYRTRRYHVHYVMTSVHADPKTEQSPL